MRLLLSFGIPQSDLADQSAEVTAETFSHAQFFLEGYEVRRAKRYEYFKDGSAFCKYEVWGEYDVKKMAAEVEKRLIEKAQEKLTP